MTWVVKAKYGPTSGRAGARNDRSAAARTTPERTKVSATQKSSLT